MSYSPSELAGMGYPQRPDPERTPAAYAGWLHAVSTPSAQVHTRAILPNSSHFPYSYSGSGAGCWNGFITNNNWGLTFEGATATWTVPEVGCDFANEVGCQSALWVGVDGWGTSDVIQTGTDHYAFWYPDQSGNWWEVISYAAWVEYFPADAIYLFTVTPGDSIWAMAHVAAFNGAVNPNGGYGMLDIQDLNTNQYATYSIPIPNGAPAYTGKTAEWILEDPYCAVKHLTPYSFPNASFMTGASSLDSTFGWVSYDQEFQGVTNAPMFRLSTTLSNAFQQGYPAPPGGIWWQWEHF
jgi:hypothetical protein